MKLKDIVVLTLLMVGIGSVTAFLVYHAAYFDYEDYDMLKEATFKVAVITGVSCGWTVYKGLKHRKNLTFDIRAKMVLQAISLFLGTYAILQFFFWVF